jgi:predicted nucleic acid-binding OB-fold protein
MSQKDETAAITIEPLNIIHSRRLAEIIGTDEKLHMQLTPSKPMQKTNAGEFYNFCSSWCKRTNSDSYAVLLDGIPIGLISLSQKDHETKTVKCGYWI